MNFIQLKTRGGEQRLINVEHIVEVYSATDEECVLRLINGQYRVRHSFQELKVLLNV